MVLLKDINPGLKKDIVAYPKVKVPTTVMLAYTAPPIIEQIPGNNFIVETTILPHVSTIAPKIEDLDR